MTLTFAAILAATALMFGTLAAHEAGRRIGVLRRRRGTEDEGAAAPAVRSPVGRVGTVCRECGGVPVGDLLITSA